MVIMHIDEPFFLIKRDPVTESVNIYQKRTLHMNELLCILGAILLIGGAVYLAQRVTNKIRGQIDEKRIRQRALAVRADWQHRQIIRGDVTNGTYGAYMPPESLIFIRNTLSQ